LTINAGTLQIAANGALNAGAVNGVILIRDNDSKDGTAFDET
jgi:hypothetical protein